jgi:hypothetical protein
VTRDEILAAVVSERKRQEVLWGEQNHPDAGPIPELERHYARQRADEWKRVNAVRVRGGFLSWDGILLEEVYEALAESDPEKLRTELVQSMAVILNWLECISRRYGKEAA